MTKMFPACAGAALAVIVPAWLLTVPLSAQGQGRPREGQAQERGEARGGGGGGGGATPHAGQGPSGGGSSSGGSSQGSGGGFAGGSSPSGGGRSESDGPRRSGPTGGGGYAMPRDRADRPSARPSDGSGATSSGGGATTGEGRYRGAPRDGGARVADTPSTGGEGVPTYARPRDGREPVGTAVPRGTVPMATPPRGTVYVPGGYYGGYGYSDPWGYGGYGGYGGGYGGYGAYPGGYGGYYGGYYDPWYGGYPDYGQTGGYSQTFDDDGSLKLKLKPRNAEVYVDGYFVGVVDDFDGIFQRLRLESGPHRIEVKAPGYEPLAFDVRITPDHTTTYQGELTRVP
jgi:hypothetical protein